MRGGEVAEEGLTGPGGGDPGEGTRETKGRECRCGCGWRDRTFTGTTPVERPAETKEGAGQRAEDQTPSSCWGEITSETQRLQSQELGETQGR